MSEDSLYRLYSLGIAAENKPLGATALEVIPLEMTNLADGELSGRGEAMETGGTDSSGKRYADRVVTSPSIPAEWRRDGDSNRVTAPDVRRGERVKIYTYGDTGQFFWTTDGNDSHLRRLETVVYAFSATPDESVEKLDDSNSYVVEVSTHNKRIIVRTSTANGERCLFHLEINPGEERAILADSANQEISMFPLERRISAINADDTQVHLKENDLLVEAKGLFSVTVNGGAVVKAPTAVVDSPEVTLTGDAKVGGNLQVGGDMQVGGFSKLNGASSPAPITAPNIN